MVSISIDNTAFIYFLGRPFLIYRFKLRVKRDKKSLAMLFATGLSFLIVVITPRAAAKPWTQRQALILFLILSLFYLRLNVTHKRVMSN